MNTSTPRLRSLLRQARKVADAGKLSAAESLYRQIIDETADSEEAWLGLAQVLSGRDQKVEAYKRVLSLNPGNQEARAALADLEDHLPSTPVQEPAQQSPLESADVSPDGRESGGERSDEVAPVPAVSPAIQAIEHDHDHDLEEEAFHELVCYRHPNRETALRCYSCGRPICSECAVKTPVGYRCPTCIREAEDVFFNARATDYVIAPLVSLPLSLLSGFLVLQLGGGFLFILIILFVGGAIGSLIGRVAKRAVGRRRGRYLPHIVAATVILGVALPVLFIMLLSGSFSLGLLLMPGIYAFVATSSAFYQMK